MKPSRAGGKADSGAEGEGQVAIEMLLVICAFVLPILVVLPFMLDLVFRYYNLVVYVLLQPGP